MKVNRFEIDYRVIQLVVHYIINYYGIKTDKLA
jgi:hypothetical protein